MFRTMIAALMALSAALAGTASAQLPAPKTKTADVKLSPLADAARPDLGKFLRFNATTTSVSVNEKARAITVVVKNTGATKLSSLDVRTTVAFTTPVISPAQVAFEQTKTVRDLAPGETRVVTYAFDMAAFRTQTTQELLGEGLPTFIISGIADPGARITETNEGDNTKQITLR